MIDIAQLLQPIAGASRSGVDPQADSRFEVIRATIEKGSSASETELRKLKIQIPDLLNDGRSLDLLVYLATVLVVTDGWQGVRDGLVLLAGSISEYWDDMHPLPDMEEPEDERYWVRCNMLAQLGEPPNKPGDPLSYLTKVLQAPLAISGRSSPGFWAVWELDHGGTNVEAATAVKEQLGRLSDGDRQTLRQWIADSITAVQKIEAVVAEKAGIEYSASLDEHLLTALQAIGKVMDTVGGGLLGAEEAPVRGATQFDAGVPIKPAPQPAAPAGTIQNSDDVRRALTKVIEYYRKTEPSSPVPYLLQRALKLVDADFMDIIKNLNNDAEHQFRTTLDIIENS
ncbi:MAG: type VI secretion system ImpA family N-terminal domain-containing protein [Verrucomicrobia bacterium]|nr:type VI secretion system ImpA family N-terminal domain-containing protein [Verrucomicrobiota bacterium]